MVNIHIVNTVRGHARGMDIGDEDIHVSTIEIDRNGFSGVMEVSVRYRVDYPSMFHRGYGREPSVRILGAQAIDPVTSELREIDLTRDDEERILVEIESAELCNALRCSTYENQTHANNHPSLLAPR